MERPIMNPSNPYIGTLRIFPGTLVKVAGRARVNATRFAINFQTGPSMNPRDDLALHLSPCFTPPRVVRNSLQHGSWGLEEAWGNGAIVSPHSPFEIIILAEPDQFKIAINGAHYCEFKHRIPYQAITHLTIDGDVDIERISITESQTPYQPSAPASAGPLPMAGSYAGGSAPYPSGPNPSMPMPPIYPNLDPSHQSGPYPTMPSAGHMPSGPMPAGPMPTGSSYTAGYPQAPGSYPQQPYPQAGYVPAGGPAPAGASYQGGYPNMPPQQHHQPGHPHASSSGPFGMGGKALGTIAGLGLGAAAGAAVLSAVNPLKQVKKIMKPKKMFKHKGWGGRSSSSSNSSRSSFSSNSS